MKEITLIYIEWDTHVLTTVLLLEYLGDVRFCFNFCYFLLLLIFNLSFLVLLGSVLFWHSVGFHKCHFSLDFIILDDSD
jgi:hypothetical protein